MRACWCFSLGLPTQTPGLPLHPRRNETRRADGAPQRWAVGAAGSGRSASRTWRCPGATHLPARPDGAATSSSSSGGNSGRTRQPGAGAPLAADLPGGRGPHMGCPIESHVSRRPAESYAPFSSDGLRRRGLHAAPPAGSSGCARRSSRPSAQGGGARSVPHPRTAGARAACQGEGNVP